MRRLQWFAYLTALLVIGISGISLAQKQDVFKRYMLFPGPNLSSEDCFEDLAPNRTPNQSFRIGKLVFAYHDPPIEKKLREAEIPVLFSQVISVQEAVKRAQANQWLTALINQHTGLPYQFKFEKASLTDLGDEGYQWDIQWALYPEVGGFSGIPPRYHAKVSAEGELIPPHMYLVEEFCLAELKGWVLCRLELKQPSNKDSQVLDKKQIRENAMKAWREFKQSHKQIFDSELNQLRFAEMSKVKIPIAQSKQAKLIYEEVWAVKMISTTTNDKEEAAVPFYLWVRPTGEVGKIFYLDGWIEKTVR